MPQWLTEFDALDIEEGSAELLEEEDQFSLQSAMQAEAGRVLRSNNQFLEQLQACKDLAGLHVWAADLGIELRKYSRLAYRQLYESERSLSNGLDALGDNALNNSDNLDFLLRRLAQIPLTFEDAETLGNWIKRTLSLGQRSQSQIRLLSDFVLHVSTVNPDQNQEELKCRFAASIFEGLESSTVFGIKDLDHRTLGILLKAITRGTFGQKSQDMGFRIIKALDPSQCERLVYSISLFIQTEIEAQAPILATARQQAQHLGAIPRSFEMLRDLDVKTACRVIVDTTKALINHTKCLPETNVPLIKLLDQWWSWIRRSEWLERVERGNNKKYIERLLTGKPPVIVATYLRHLNDGEVARFILRKEFGTGMDPDDRPRATDFFHEMCKTHDDQSPFISMLRAAHQYSELPDRKLQRTFRLLQMLQKSELIVNIIVELRKVNIRISEQVILHTIRTGMHWEHHRAEAIFAAYPELALEQCPELAERMIKNSRRYPKEALSQYTRRHPYWSAAGCRDPPRNIRARAQLLQRMALAYSAAPHLTPRMAFRMVYTCYIRHIREHLGYQYFSTATVLALVRAGIVRPLEQGQWVSTERIQWLLKLIRRFESWEVADQVDQAIYEWRGIVIKKIQEDYHRRKRTQYGLREAPMSFRIRNDWNFRLRILTPLKNHGSNDHVGLSTVAKLQWDTS